MRSELNTHQSYKYEVIKGQSGGVWVFFAFSSFGTFTKTEFCDYNNGNERYHTKK